MHVLSVFITFNPRLPYHFAPALVIPVEIASHRRLLQWTCLVCTLLLFALAGPLLARRVSIADDLGSFHLPLRWFYADCLASGEAFDWCPYLFGGFYASGEGQAGMYHPLHLALYRWLPLDVAFGLELFLSYPALLVGTWLWLRRHVDHPAAALLGAMAFAFSSFTLLHFVHPNAIAVVAHLPWLLWCIDVALRGDNSRKAQALLGIGLLTTSQLLLGYPQYVWFSLLAEGPYIIWIAMGPGKTGHVGVGRIALAKLLGLLAAGIQVWPTLDALSHSTRQELSDAFIFNGSLHPLNVLQLIQPYLFATRVAGQNTHELTCYLGAGPLMLLVWAACCAPRQSRCRLMRFLLLLGAVAGLLALGQYGGIYRLQTWLPLVGKFRMPGRYVVLVCLAAAGLAAIAFARLLAASGQRKATWRELGPLWRLTLASVALACVGPLLWPAFVAQPLLIWTGPLLMGVAALLVSLVARQVRIAPALLVAFIALDLGSYGLSYAVYPHTARLTDYLQAGQNPLPGGDVRAAVDLIAAGTSAAHTGNQILVQGCRLIDGYAGLEPQRRLDYRTLPALQIAGVARVLRRDTTAELDELLDAGAGRVDAKTQAVGTVQGVAGVDETLSKGESKGEWIAISNPLPRVRLVSQAQVSDNPGRDLAQIPLDSIALVERGVRLAPGPPGEATLLTDRPGRLLVQTTAPTRQLLVVSESFHAGWQAALDGFPVEVLRVNGDFMGIVVEPGNCVAMTFQPASLKYGKWLSVLGLSGLLLIFGLTDRRSSQAG